jgi:nitroreductase
MDVLDSMKNRHCARAFLPEVPSREAIARAVLAAGTAASSKNGQPWMLHVALGASCDRVRDALCAAFDSGTPSQAEYRYSPAEMPKDMMDRARACGIGLFAHKGIGREDKAGRQLHDRENVRLFGANAFALLTLPKVAEKGTFLDGGLFLGQFLLALRAEGLEATPMYSVAGYPQVLRQEMSIPDDRLVVCGVAFGFEDPDGHVNTYRTGREPVENILSWV